MTAVPERWPTNRSSDDIAAHSRRVGDRLDVVAERAAAIGVGVLIVTGFLASYTTLRDLAAGVGGFPGWLAPVVPLSFDVGIVVLSLKVVLAARAGRRARVLRVLVVALSATTVLVNGAAASGLAGALLHAVPSAMFVICFETVAAGARSTALTETSAAADGWRLPGVRWLLAPRGTLTLWREHVLEGTTGVGPHPAHGTVSVRHSMTSPTKLRCTWPGEAPTSPDVDEPTEAAEQTAGITDPAIAGEPAPSAEGRSATRHAVALDAVRRDADITAVALADLLRAAGHDVSVRTAQRTRNDALRRLAVENADGSAS